MLEVRQHSHDLIKMTECRDERAHGVGIPQIVEKLELVEDADRTACDIDFLNGNIVWPPRGSPTVSW